MAEEIQDAVDAPANWSKQWQRLRRRRWWLAMPLFTVWAVVWSVSWFLPAVYRSETLILVEQQKVPEQYVVSNVTADLQERLQSMTQQMMSRTRLLRIMDEFQLYPELRSRRTPDEWVERMRQDIQMELVQAPNRRGDLAAFKIAYLCRNARLAQQVASRLSSLFIEENLKSRQQQSQETTNFLQSQLGEARQSLSEQEMRVKEFKSRYLGELPGQVQSNMQILGGLQSQLQQEMEALGHAKQQSVYLESLLGQWRSAQGGAVLAPSAVDQELESQRAQLADLSAHYTERHPDIRKLQEAIIRTEALKQRLRPAGELGGGGAVRSSPGTPLAELESQLKANRVEIANREKSVKGGERQIQGYQSRLNTAPLREQQLADLTRDYDQSRKNYESLLAKLDDSSMATNLEKRQQGEQFRVLDPPNLPQKPYSPQRLRLSLIGLLAGLVLGVGGMAGAEAVDDRIYCRADLKEVSDAPVLSEIPPLLTVAEVDRKKRQSIWQWVAMAAMVAATAAGFGITYWLG